MENIKININNSISGFIEFTNKIHFNASQDQPYYANININNHKCEILFEYLFNSENKELLQTNECSLEYGIVSGKIYSFKLDGNLSTITIQNIKYIFSRIDKYSSKENRFESNIRNMKLIIESIVNYPLTSLENGFLLK